MCTVNEVDLSYVPGIFIRNFELKASDLKVSNELVSKFKSLNKRLEILAQQKAELAIKHKWTEIKNSNPQTS